MTGTVGFAGYGGWLAVEPENARPGYGALLLVLGLAVVTYLLWRSMNTQLGKIQMPPSAKGSGDAGQQSGTPSESGVDELPAQGDDDTRRRPDTPG